MANAYTTLAEYAKINPRTFENMVRSKVSNVSDLLRHMIFQPLTGSSFKYNQEATLPTSGFRALNGTVDLTVGTNNSIDVPIAYAAGKTFIDDTMDQATENDQIDKAIRAMGLNINETLFKGDRGTTATEFDGLQQIVKDGYATEIINATNGAALSLAKLDATILALRGTQKVLAMSDSMYLKFQTAAKSTVGGNVNFVPNNFGEFVLSYAGIPILRAGDTAAGASVLPFDETTGSSDVTTSIYALDLADGFRGLQAQDMNVKRVEADFGKTFSLSWNVSCFAREKYGIVKLSGITDAAIVA